MTHEKLKKLYGKKKKVLDEAEVRVRKALIHSRREANIESTVLYHIDRLQKAHGDLATNIDLLARGKTKPRVQPYFTKEVSDVLGQMGVIQHQVREMLKDLRREKKAGYRNTQDLMRDFKKLNALREKMDKHLE